MTKKLEDLRILQIGVNYIFETQRVSKRPFTGHKNSAMSFAAEIHRISGSVYN